MIKGYKGLGTFTDFFFFKAFLTQKKRLHLLFAMLFKCHLVILSKILFRPYLRG